MLISQKGDWTPCSSSSFIVYFDSIFLWILEGEWLQFKFLLPLQLCLDLSHWNIETVRVLRCFVGLTLWLEPACLPWNILHFLYVLDSNWVGHLGGLANPIFKLIEHTNDLPIFTWNSGLELFVLLLFQFSL